MECNNNNNNNNNNSNSNSNDNDNDNDNDKKEGDVDEIGEAAHFLHVINTFRSYSRFASQIIKQQQKNFTSLPLSHQNILLNATNSSNSNERFEDLLEKVKANQIFLNAIADFNTNLFQDTHPVRKIEKGADGVNVKGKMEEESSNNVANISVEDYNKVETTLRQFVRDWSDEGEQERKECYHLILQCIQRHFPNNSANILVPGCGLGRLVLDIAALGHSCQGNEFSYHMLLASGYILNYLHKEKNCYSIYPWITNFSNSLSHASQSRKTAVPNVLPSVVSNMEGFGNMSMMAGDFIEVYTREDDNYFDSFDCVVTCFFLDTARNVMDYINTIVKILKKGKKGRWINYGPLLYHHTDKNCYEMSWDEIKRVMIHHFGFIIEEEKLVNTSYNSNVHSMMKTNYCCVFVDAVLG